MNQSQYHLNSSNPPVFHSYQSSHDFTPFPAEQHLENQVSSNPFLSENMHTNMYFNHLFNNISNKMYGGVAPSMIYPGFQNGFKNESFMSNNNPGEMNENKAMKKKMNNEENEIFTNLGGMNGGQKNFIKNTYMKKINSLFSQKSSPLESLKKFQDNCDMFES